jgi:hypothetical protein
MARKVKEEKNIEYFSRHSGNATTVKNKAALLMDSPKGEWISS